MFYPWDILIIDVSSDHQILYIVKCLYQAALLLFAANAVAVMEDIVRVPVALDRQQAGVVVAEVPSKKFILNSLIYTYSACMNEIETLGTSNEI